MVALIWAEGYELAPLWKDYAEALAKSEDSSLSDERRGAAYSWSQRAKAKYKLVIDEATEALWRRARAGQARTHVFVAGVGNYDAAKIKTLSTAVHGAHAFTEWMLTRFEKPDRPLGSIELLTSLAPHQNDWTPPQRVAAQLGFHADASVSIPAEPATFAHLQAAFDSWLKRAQTFTDNAAIFYFAGHGVRKAELLLLAQDAQLPSENQPTKNLIAFAQTTKNMENHQPRIQCFFLDACQEIRQELINNQSASLGAPLRESSNGAIVQGRDASMYYASCAGKNAYGPESSAPYFTQELLVCLEKRAGDPTTASQAVTTDSLRKAMVASGHRRGELENKNIQFSHSLGDSVACSAELCQLASVREVLVEVQCIPKEHMRKAKLYTEVDAKRAYRLIPRPDDWYTTVSDGMCSAGAEFDATDRLADTTVDFKPVPPVYPVAIKVT